MSFKSPPKVIKIDLENRQEIRKSKRKIQQPKRSSKGSSTKFQKTFEMNIKNQSMKQLLLDSDVIRKKDTLEQNIQRSQQKQFSEDEVHSIKGEGYQVLWKGQQDLYSKNSEKLNFMQVNVALKIFELAEKSFQHEQLEFSDLQTLTRNLLKHLKQVYGSKNQQILTKKSSEIVENVKVLFYRKKSLSISSLVYYMIDCSVIDQVLSSMIELFPSQIQKF